MNDPKNLSGFSKTFKNIFITSLLIFLISLLPFSYRAGYFNGKQVDVVELSTPDETRANSFNTLVTAVSAVFAGLSALTSGVAGWLKSSIEYKTQKMKYETVQMEYEMQKREVENLRLKLESESKNKGKRGVKRK